MRASSINPHLVVFACFLLSSCDALNSNGKLEDRLAALEAKSATIVTPGPDRSAMTGVLESSHSMIYASFGQSAITVERPRDFAGGSEFEIGIANPSLMTVGGISFNLTVVGKRKTALDADKKEEVLNTLASKNVKFIQELNPGTWTFQKISVPEAKLEEIEFIMVENINHETIRMRN